MYHLEKYKGRNANRYVCPQCGQPHVFTRYVDDEGNYIADDVGKCDRIAKCGYHYTPRQYYTDNPWDKERRVKRRYVEPPKPRPVYLPMEYVDVRQSSDSPFVHWVRDLFGDIALKVAADYRLGATKAGLYKSPAVIFWQIDVDGRVRDGKMMWYKPNGHREKWMTWITAKLKAAGKYPDQQSEKCLFGEHLLKANPDKAVGLVESEKSAIVCACLYPDILWVATCGCGGLNADKVSPLYGHRVLVLPDTGAYYKWNEVMMSSGIDYRIVSIENYPPNTDIVDILIDKAQPREGEPTDINEIIEQWKSTRQSDSN